MATLVDPEFLAKLHALNEKFEASLPETIGRLSHARAAFDAEAPDPKLTVRMHEVLHTVAGSAATFGFRTLGQQARELEQQARVLMAFERAPEGAWAAWLVNLDRYLAWAERDPKAVYTDGDRT
ncbi:MAG: Hpt domain-containing protein [Pseudomonadota bacterium]